MKKAYKDGYEPMVDQGAVAIVIPITADLGKDIQEITVTPNLGDTMSSPFVYRNYQKSFKKTKEPVNDGREKREVFLISYTLPLRSDRINGIYPVMFDVKADTGMSEVMASFTIYVQITDGKDPSDGENVDIGGGMAEAKPESQPKLIISKCTSSPERIEAGQEFVLTAEIKNTNKNLHIQNMTIEVGWSEPGLSLLEDSKTIYVDRLGSGKTLEIPLKFKAENNLAEGRYDITLSMNYDNPEAVSMNSTGTISVDIYQPLRIELEAGKLPDSINAGDTFTLQIQALNLGRGDIYNARCTIDVPGLSSGTSLFLGNIAAGSAVGGDIKIFAGMKDESVYGSTYGPTSGKLTLSYEDEEGNVYSEEVEVSTTVNQLVVNAPSENAEKQAEKTLGMQWVIGVVIIIAVLAAGGIYLSKRKKENEKK